MHRKRGPAIPADFAPARASSAAPRIEATGPRPYSEIAGTVPALRLDLHVYAASPADRYAYINMRKVHEGDTTPDGVRVEQITSDGVVLRYRDSEFLLGQ